MGYRGRRATRAVQSGLALDGIAFTAGPGAGGWLTLFFCLPSGSVPHCRSGPARHRGHLDPVHDQLVAHAQCMRTHGVLNDPNPMSPDTGDRHRTDSTPTPSHPPSKQTEPTCGTQLSGRPATPRALVGGWITPAVADGAFTLHPLLIAVPSAVCFVLGLLDWRRPWRVEHLDVLALAGFFPVAMLLSDDVSQAGLWLAAVCLGWLFCRMLGATFGIWRMPELRPSISSRRLGNPDTAARSDRKCRGGQHSGCRAGELARRLARSARTAPLRGGVLAGPRWASDLPPGLLRPVRLLRVHPIRGCLPAGAARDAAAGGVLRRADTRRPAQADLPDPFIRLPPVLLHVPGEDLLQRPRGRVRRHAGTPCLVQGIHHLPVNIQLDLRGCRVADAHRAGAFVAGQPAQLQLGEPAFTRGTVHDLQLGGISTRTTLA